MFIIKLTLCREGTVKNCVDKRYVGIYSKIRIIPYAETILIVYNPKSSEWLHKIAVMHFETFAGSDGNA